ncbi:hypothetical protein MNBD_ALPHA06-2268 [hydrothermal vent metagenome]|uniref:Uncharacterized protein n=1 Tax=hydrothermal vent metagenome TaxID=652676 RepID=A0A3B0SJ99_9ZZZZ
MLSAFFSPKNAPAPTAALLPDLDLSGPILAENFKAMVHGCETLGGVERYIEALKLKHTLFREAVEDGALEAMTEETLPGCAHLWPRYGGGFHHICMAKISLR